MQVEVEMDDELLKSARESTGIVDDTGLLNEALRALIRLCELRGPDGAKSLLERIPGKI